MKGMTNLFWSFCVYVYLSVHMSVWLRVHIVFTWRLEITNIWFLQSLSTLFINFFNVYVHMPECMYVFYEHAGNHRSQERMFDALQLGLQVAGNCPMLVL